MIINTTKTIIGAETIGFDASTSGLSLVVGAGKLIFFNKQEGSLPDEIEEYSFPAFTFDVVPDDELQVTYDIYLCGDNTIAVERIEMMEGVIPSYSGEKELLHCLASFTVAPNVDSLDEQPIEVIKLIKGDEGA